MTQPDSSSPLGAKALLEQAEWLRRLAGVLVLEPGGADDLAQETWLAALRRPPAEGDVRGWLATVARNAARKSRRQRDRRDRREQEAARPEAQPAADEVVARAALSRRVVDEVLALDEPYRSTLLLRYFEDLPPREIAQRLERPVNTVRTHLERGLARLRRRLDAEFGDRESWCVALLPFVPEGSVLAARGATTVSIGALLMSWKVLLPVALSLLAVLALRNDAPDPSVPELVEEPPHFGDPVVVSTERPADAPAEDTPEAARVPASSIASTEPSAPDHVHTGRVVDARGEPLEGLLVEFTDSSWPRRVGDLVQDGNTGIEPNDELVAILRDHPEIVSELFPESRHPERVRALFLGEEPEVPAARTDAAGRYELTLDFERADLKLDDPAWVLIASGRRELADGAFETLVVVAPAVAVSGRVVEAAGGAPIPGASVHMGCSVEGLPGFPYTVTDASYHGWSDDAGPDGGFDLGAVPRIEGARLSVTATGFDWASVPLEEAGRGPLVVRLERLTKKDVHELDGVVLDADGLPVAGARVSFGQNGASTDDDGRFSMSFRYFSKGNVLIARHGDVRPAVLEGIGEQLRARPEVGRNLVLRLGGETWSVRGRVVDADGRPRAGVQVELLDGLQWRSTTAYVEDELAQRPRAGLQTDMQGRFELGGLFRERYSIRARDPESFLCAVAADLTPASGELELVLDPGRLLPTLRGRVVDSAGRPVERVELGLSALRFVSADGRSRSWHQLALGETDADGRFELRDVPHEHVTLSLHGPEVKPTRARIDPAAATELVIPVELELRFRLAERWLEAADAFEAQDADGSRLPVAARLPDLSSQHDRTSLRGRYARATFQVSDAAVELVFFVDDVEHDRCPLALRRGELVVVE